MIVCTTTAELRESLKALRSEDAPIGLVPTMGALHAGHADLVRRSVAESATVVSIFVNPTQFGPNEDFDRYPRDPEADLRICREAGASIVFMPSVEEMYPGTQASRLPASPPLPAHLGISLQGLNKHLCGAHRPGHFEGVCLIVTKLFHAVQPDLAWFGQKDIQQYIILEHMVRELLFPVQMKMAPTVREADGLAMSSRNRYLTPSDREKAPSLHQALRNVESAWIEIQHSAAGTRGSGGRYEDDPSPSKSASSPTTAAASIGSVLARERERLVSNGMTIDYFGMYDRETLQPVSEVSNRDSILAGAVHLGSTRLIDNLIVSFRPE
jgi:pantoate--beta-alanine ligase